MKKNAILFLLMLPWSIEMGFTEELPLDFKQSVKEFSSDEHLKKIFAKSVEQRAERLFKLINNSIAKAEKMAIKEVIAKRGVNGIMDKIEWDSLVGRWQKRLQNQR
ncbi:MAG: hypothetical protein HYV97_00250 [Bdellovibrio sp.]|nr:hypothetical protein [Bdellovibrio sp.]